MTAPRTTDSTTARGSRGGRGLEIVLITVYAIFALSATARSLVQVLRDFDRAPVAYSLSLLAAVTYIAVTVALVRGGRRSRVARVLVVVELIGVLVVGTLTLVDPALFPEATVWSLYGQGYGYVPLALPVLALAYMLLGDRRRAPAAG
jgi:cytochrome bd-type quinol oxidase subunit 2